jgi:hypothetical protein
VTFEIPASLTCRQLRLVQELVVRSDGKGLQRGRQIFGRDIQVITNTSGVRVGEVERPCRKERRANRYRERAIEVALNPCSPC